MDTNVEESGKDAKSRADIWFVVACLATIGACQASISLYVGSDLSAAQAAAIGLGICIGRIWKGDRRTGYWVMGAANLLLYGVMVLEIYGR